MAAVTAIGVQHFVPSTDLIVYIAIPAPMQPLAEYTQSSILRNVNLRNHWRGGARKRINQKGSEPGNAIISGDFP
jgi:hypothetical protein